ncbi:MAG TPA: DinB family protein [Candidatus Avamphibacillus sp.]|nr:DinB family protein [Candidatus Avamphibacillus sp.]
MMDTIDMFKYSRAATIIALGNADEKDLDVQPEGYPNTLRWNAGHIYSTAEEFLHKADHSYEISNPKWFDYFIDGTRPSEWPEEGVPSIEEIIEALKEQEKKIENHFKGKLDQPASEDHVIRTINLDSADAALQFCLWHEGIHLGVIKSLLIAVKQD